MYSRPLTTLGPFFIGLIVGQFLDKIKTKSSLSSFQLRFIFAAALSVLIATIYGILPEYWHPEQGNTLYNTLYTASFRTIFAAAIATMIIAIYLDNNR